MKKLLFWAGALILIMIIIFVFSSFNAEQSGGKSDFIVNAPLSVLYDWFGISLTTAVLNWLSFLVRKSAHLFIYFALGFCAANTLSQITDNRKRVFWISLCWCSFYGATDEIHQYFIPGRSAMWQDWVLDTVGALIGVGVVLFHKKRWCFIK